MQTVTAGWAAAFIAAIAAYFQIRAARSADRRLVLAGLPAGQLAAARALTGLALAAVVSAAALVSEARAMATGTRHVSYSNVYASAKTGRIAAVCGHHRGMHLFEDLVIPEVVNDAHRPVPLGQPGTRPPVTLLFSRNVLLIRYDMTDRV